VGVEAAKSIAHSTLETPSAQVEMGFGGAPKL
jgi:hypothetical protein